MSRTYKSKMSHGRCYTCCPYGSLPWFAHKFGNYRADRSYVRQKGFKKQYAQWWKFDVEPDIEDWWIRYEYYGWYSDLELEWSDDELGYLESDPYNHLLYRFADIRD
jgi:hypothetical protein